MSEKSVELLLYLRKNEFILKKSINDLNINNNNDCSSGNKCIECQLIFDKIKSLFNENNDSINDKLCENEMKETQNVININSNENKTQFNELEIKKLDINVNKTQQNNEKLKITKNVNFFLKKRQLKRSFINNSKVLKNKDLIKNSIKSHLNRNKSFDSNKEKNIEQNSRKTTKNKTLIISSEEISSISDINKTQSKSNFNSKAKKTRSKRSNKSVNSRKKSELSRDLIYKCDQKGCNKRFATNSGVYKHMNSFHMKLKPHKCHFESCNKRFSAKSSLNVHIKRHLGSKLFKCDQNDCDMRFVTSGDLKAHLRNKHSKDMPFKCHFNGCDYSAICSRSISFHIRSVHKEDKPFRCHFADCGLKFGRKDVLEDHINRHLGYKPYKCEYNGCKYSSVTYTNLNRHIRYVHNKHQNQ